MKIWEHKLTEFDIKDTNANKRYFDVKNIKNSSKNDFYTCFLLRYFQKYTADNIQLILSSKVNKSPIIAPL